MVKSYLCSKDGKMERWKVRWQNESEAKMDAFIQVFGNFLTNMLIGMFTPNFANAIWSMFIVGDRGKKFYAKLAMNMFSKPVAMQMAIYTAPAALFTFDSSTMFAFCLLQFIMPIVISRIIYVKCLLMEAIRYSAQVFSRDNLIKCFISVETIVGRLVVKIMKKLNFSYFSLDNGKIYCTI